jgi:hypothetical protein
MRTMQTRTWLLTYDFKKTFTVQDFNKQKHKYKTKLSSLPSLKISEGPAQKNANLPNLKIPECLFQAATRKYRNIREKKQTTLTVCSRRLLEQGADYRNSRLLKQGQWPEAVCSKQGRIQQKQSAADCRFHPAAADSTLLQTTGTVCSCRFQSAVPDYRGRTGAGQG